MGEDNKIIYEIRENVVEIKTTLVSVVQNTDLKFQIKDEQIEGLKKRIRDLEETIKWLWRTIAGSLIAAIMAILLNIK